jgi:hypothetical protein
MRERIVFHVLGAIALIGFALYNIGALIVQLGAGIPLKFDLVQGVFYVIYIGTSLIVAGLLVREIQIRTEHDRASACRVHL